MSRQVDQTGNHIYREKLTSNKTELLFLALAVLFLFLSIWRLVARGWHLLAMVFGLFFILFLFYSVNFRVLDIRLFTNSLRLTFGIFSWTIPLENIEDCHLEDIPAMMKYGGAGIHFMSVRKRYRASFNFLEFPRVVLLLKKKIGPVQDISFSTRQPDAVINLIRKAVYESDTEMSVSE